MRSENVGISSKKTGENPVRRKPEVSWATQIDPGLVGPKARLKSVADGQQVNIPALPLCYLHATLRRIVCVFWLYACAAARLRSNPKFKWLSAVGRKVCNTRKGGAKKNRDVTHDGIRTGNRHRWVGTSVPRRTRETSFRNSAINRP